MRIIYHLYPEMINQYYYISGNIAWKYFYVQNSAALDAMENWNRPKVARQIKELCQRREKANDASPKQA